MRVLVVSTNRCQKPMVVMPLGACMVAEAAERAGHAVRLLDMMFLRSPLQALERELRSFRPDVVGLSIRNIDNNDILHPSSLLTELPPVIETIRRFSRAEIVIGGSAVGVMPEALMRSTGASWTVHTDGEIAFPRLLSALARGEDPRHVPGVGWLEMGHLSVGRPPRLGAETVVTEEVFLDEDSAPEHVQVWRPGHATATKGAAATQVIEIDALRKEASAEARLRTFEEVSRPRCEPLSSVAPDFSRWLNCAAYAGAMCPAPMQTKRGCPFECVYCTYALNEGSIYRLSSPESVVEGVKRHVQSGFHDIEFVDNVFNSPYEHAVLVCEALAAERTRARLHTVEINPRFLDDALLETMEMAGFESIGITAESASDRVLVALNKGYSADDVVRAAESIARHNLPCLWVFMLGGPGECEASVRETFRFAERFIRPEDIALFNVGVRIYPRTVLEQIARSEGILRVPADDMLQPCFYISPSVSIDWLLRETKAAVAAHPNYIGPSSLDLPFIPILNRLGHRLGARPPLWRHTRLIRRMLKLVGRDT